ncbi:MAG: minichromosome maintenance protein MCM [Candidatus Methanospirare jalkutatii]|nr:minichromosome maintenance protein MCM [Candidatus Methanospirare jalkutatii]
MSEELTERWEEFLRKYYWDEVVALSLSDVKSLRVKFSDVLKFDGSLADMILEHPEIALECAKDALRRIDETLEDAHVRIYGIPVRKKIREIRSEDIGRLICVEGLVLKATEVRPKVVVARFECPLCHNVFEISQSESGDAPNRFKEPELCESCGRKAKRFKLLTAESIFVNAQKIRIQEAPEELRGGELPQVIDVNLEDDLAGIVSPGDRVEVIGILKSFQRRTHMGATPFFDVYLEGVWIERKEGEFEEIEISDEDERSIKELASQPDIYEKLRESIAPFIYGYDEIKEALLLQLFGGVPKELPDGTRIRGDIHILLVGDPGVAKSQMLSHIVELAPRGIYTGGKSSTGAGLTAVAVRDEFGEGRWTLEAGALVLADKGIAAVDEIDKMEKKDRDALHEVMEQQTVSIAKAGITARLNARCALLAAANPKLGRFDKYTPISEQINLPPTLLSRFDLIFTMMDEPDEETDRKTAEHILDAHIFGEILTRNRMKGKSISVESVESGHEKEGEESERGEEEGESEALLASRSEVMRKMESAIPAELLRKYVAYARKNVFPVLSDAARRRFLEFYIGLRRQSYDDENAPVPVTARQLEALIRLGEARARASLREVVTEEDAEHVINLVSYCLRRVFVDPETGRMDVDVVSVGISKAKRDKMTILTDIIKELSQEYGENVPREEVLNVAEQRGIPREKAEELIEKMCAAGILFAPDGYRVLKVVR